MTTDRVIEILLAGLTLIAGYASFRFATRATAEQARAARVAVDAAAYERAKDIYESALGTLRRDLAGTRADLVTAHEDIATLRQEIRELRTELKQARAEIFRLRTR